MSTDTSQAAPDLVTDPARSPGTWILGRILLALGLMVGYYVFSIGIAAGLGWLGVAHFMGLITLPGRRSG